MFEKLKKLFEEPKVPPVDVGTVKLTIELKDGRTTQEDVDGDAISNSMGNFYMDASYIASNRIKSIFKHGVRIGKNEVVPPHQIAKILLGDRKQLMKEYE